MNCPVLDNSERSKLLYHSLTVIQLQVLERQVSFHYVQQSFNSYITSSHGYKHRLLFWELPYMYLVTLLLFVPLVSQIWALGQVWSVLCVVMAGLGAS